MSQYKTSTKLFLRLKVSEIGTRSYHALGPHIYLRWKAQKNQGMRVVKYKLACAPPRKLK